MLKKKKHTVKEVECCWLTIKWKKRGNDQPLVNDSKVDRCIRRLEKLDNRNHGSYVARQENVPNKTTYTDFKTLDILK